MTITTKRANWINLGMGLLFGPQSGGPRPPSPQGVYLQIALLEAWTNEGVACGFIPASANGSAANSVVDGDFTTVWPAVTAASFLAAVAVLQTLNAAWTTGYATVAAIKP